MTVYYYLKALRKLAEKRSKVDKQSEKKDIINDFANFASKVHIPKLRDGIISSEKISITDIAQVKPIINNYLGIEELEFKYATIINNIPTSIPNSHNDSTPASLRRVNILNFFKFCFLLIFFRLGSKNSRTIKSNGYKN